MEFGSQGLHCADQGNTFVSYAPLRVGVRLTISRTLLPGSPVPLNAGDTFFDTVLVPEQAASDSERQNSEYFQVELMLNREKHFTSTINRGRWYRCVEGAIQSIHQ